MFSPDASVIRLDRWSALSSEQPRGFAPLCPDLLVELASPSDEGPRGLTALRRKMAAYQANGARLGWLLISYDQAVEVWPASGAPLATGSPSMWRLIIDAPLAPVPLPKASALGACRA